MMAFFRLVKKTFSLDYRSLAFYRFFIGLIVAIDSMYRMLDLTNFYTDVGMIPRSLFLTEIGMPWSFSLLLANGSKEFAFVMLALNALIGFMLMVGFKTRWMIFFAYIMNVSIHNRNWLINNGGDDILRGILFISVFLPMNKCFSIDSALRREKEKLSPDGHISTWALMFFLQASVIYFISWILKDHDIWRRDFTALFYASRLDIFSTPLGLWLRQFTGLQSVLTVWTIILEWGGPLLLIFSFTWGRFWWVARLIVILNFWALHLGIIATMWIGVFPYTCLVMWSIFLPGPFWDHVQNYVRRKNYGEMTLFFDGDCRFCEKAVRILREFLLLPEVKIEKAQSRPEIEALMKKENSWVVRDSQGVNHFRYDGFLAILRQSAVGQLFVPLAKLFQLPGEVVYKWIAAHRPFMSKFSQHIEFTEPKKPFMVSQIFYHAFGAFMFITLLMWNLTTIKKLEFKAPFFQNVTRWFHLYQEWNMFSPYPKLDNVWVEAPAILMDGSEIDLITGSRDVYSIKDNEFVAAVKNEHWRKFYLNVSEKVDNSRYFGGFLCRLWNERNEGLVPNVKLRKMEIVVYSQMNLPNGDKGGIVRKSSWKHWCFDDDYKRESKDAFQPLDPSLETK